MAQSGRFPLFVLAIYRNGAIAKRLCTGLQIRVGRFDSGSRLQIKVGCPLRPDGEIGRHKGLKIPRQRWRTGSIPVPGTTFQFTGPSVTISALYY
jgi:hypothetical protein